MDEQSQAEIDIIRHSGLFLADWYLHQYPQAAAEGTDAPPFAFTGSRAVDASGQQTMPSYQGYYFQTGLRDLAASRH